MARMQTLCTLSYVDVCHGASPSTADRDAPTCSLARAQSRSDDLEKEKTQTNIVSVRLFGVELFENMYVGL